MAFQYRPTFTQIHSAGRLFFAGAVVLTSTSSSWASDVFPPYLIQNYGWVGQSNECTLCHTSSPGTPGTATQPFARALLTRGLIPRNPASLDTAILALGATDSDNDGASDFDELTGAGDPNDPDIGIGELIESEPVEYGCVGGTISRSTDSSPTSALVASGFVAALLLWSRRRRGA